MIDNDVPEVAVLAHAIATKAHKWQHRWDGVTPYITHPEAVADKVSGMTEKAVAYLHDVVEDTLVTLADLTKSGMPENVVGAVDAITKRYGERYDKYIKRVAGNRLATTVKLADLEHNLTNLKKGSLQDKYRIAVMYLTLIEHTNTFIGEAKK